MNIKLKTTRRDYKTTKRPELPSGHYTEIFLIPKISIQKDVHGDPSKAYKVHSFWNIYIIWLFWYLNFNWKEDIHEEYTYWEEYYRNEKEAS